MKKKYDLLAKVKQNALYYIHTILEHQMLLQTDFSFLLKQKIKAKKVNEYVL